MTQKRIQYQQTTLSFAGPMTNAIRSPPQKITKQGTENIVIRNPDNSPPTNANFAADTKQQQQARQETSTLADRLRPIRKDIVYDGVVHNTPFDLRPLRRTYDADYVRSLEEGRTPLEMMVIDLEHVNRWNKPELTSGGEIHGDEEGEQGFFVSDGPKCPDKQHSVPVYRLYGITANGMTAMASVYGFFPFVYLRCEPAIREEEIGYFVEEIERILGETDGTICTKIPRHKVMKRVLGCEPARGFCCDKFREEPCDVLKLTLGLPQYCTYLGKYFYSMNNPDNNHKNEDNSAPPGLRIRFVGQPVKVHPYNCLDATTQFLMESELTGFGWVRIERVNATERRKRSDRVEYEHGVSEAAEMEDEYGGGHCSSYSDRGKCDIEVTARYGDMKVMKGKQDLAPLRILCLDIECGNVGGFPDPSKDPIISLSMHVSNERGETIKEILLQHGSADPVEGIEHIRFWGENANATDVEKKMLGTFGEIVADWIDPDIIVGHNSKAFDLPYITDRAHLLGLKNTECLSRSKARWRPNKEIVKTRKNGDTVTSKESVIIGRIQMDTMIQIKSDPFKKERSYGLGALAQKYLKASKDDVGYKMITPLWKTSDSTRRRLGLYNMKDSQLTFGLFKEFGMVFDVIQTSRVTRIMPNTLVKSGQQVKVWAQLLHESKNPRWSPEPRLRALLPFEIPSTIQKDDKCEGATVLSPKKGMYREPVAVGDYMSLYPSIMISRNICYSTLVTDRRIADSMTIEGSCETSPTGATFVKSSKREGLVSKLLKKLLEARSAAKEELAKATTAIDKMNANSKQGALKVVANSMYGFMNASGGKLRRKCMAESVTGWGRENIAFAKRIAEGFGVEVIYGDTDSIMMRIPDGAPKKDLGEMFALLGKVCDAVTKGINRFPVQLQAEKIYYPYLLLKKKHYAGIMYTSPTTCKGIDMKGIETARRDYCPYVTESLTEVLNHVMSVESTPESVKALAISKIANLVSASVEMHKLVITRSLNKLVYANKQAHSELAKRLVNRNGGFKMTAGERIPYVITCKPGKRLVSEKSEDPMYVIEHSIPVDYEYYAGNQLKKPLVRILKHVIVPKTEEYLKRKRERNAKKKGDYTLANEAQKLLFGVEALRHLKKCVPRASSMSIGKHFKPIVKCGYCGVNVPDRPTPLPQPQRQQQQQQLSDGEVVFIGCDDEDDIHRRQQNTGLQLIKLYCEKCISNGTWEEHQRKIKGDLVDLEESYSQMRKKCAVCRGYDDDTPCVQVDCAYTFKKAICVKRIQTIKNIAVW